MRVGVIGSGFSGIASACVLAKEGFDVTIFEKNASPGGRARMFESQGYRFDMGPSWYWMPDVFENFFKQFGRQTSTYYELKRLDPSYRIFFSSEDILDVPAGVPALSRMFEKLEPGSSAQLKRFLAEGKYKYETGMNMAGKPGRSVAELLDGKLIRSLLRMHVFQPMSAYVRKYFKHPQLIQLLEFPVLFLGASPRSTPALYSLMNYADMVLGTWYPQGGMFKIVDGMTRLALELGVKFEFNATVNRIMEERGQVSGLLVNDVVVKCDYVVATADYHHVEKDLLAANHRMYTERYWQKRVMAPSCLVFYLGVNKALRNLRHHNLFFDQDLEKHAREIYEKPTWPANPLFYVSCPSRSDATVAPHGHENLFILIPIAAGLKDEDETRSKYFDMVIKRLEGLTGDSIRQHIILKRSYSIRDFSSDYNAYKGNAYGLANTLLQTANLKPSIVSKKVRNLFYAGQLTVPGPGVPPSLISGQIAARELIKSARVTGPTQPGRA